MTPKVFISSDSRGQCAVLTDEDDLDDATASGRWIKTDALEPVPQ